MRALHLPIIPSLAWASGTRLCRKWELQQLRIAPARMTPRVARWFLLGTEMWPVFDRRLAAQARAFRRALSIPSWDEAVATTWWRWAGHAVFLTQRGPKRWAMDGALLPCHRERRAASSGWTWRAEEREVWEALAPEFARQVLRRQAHAQPLPRRRHYVHMWPREDGVSEAQPEHDI